jgi:hypothetical protein
MIYLKKRKYNSLKASEGISTIKYRNQEPIFTRMQEELSILHLNTETHY